MKNVWGVRLRMWLAAAILAIGIIKHRPFIAIGVALLLAISALSTYLTRRKPAAPETRP